MTIIIAVIMICILIFIHELGHFLAAKACGVKVNEFALGMGPKLLKKQKGETLYTLRAIPIGGFCAMEGEDEESDDERAFNNKSAGEKAFILVAGAGMNFILALVLMIIVTYNMGFATLTVGQVIEGSPAQKAGIEVGDELVSINGTKLDEWNDFTEIVSADKAHEALDITIKRDSEEMTFVATPKKDEESGRYIVGIGAQREKSAFKSIVNGPKETINMTKSMYAVLKQLVTGEVSTKDLSGPVGIVYMVDQSASQGLMTFLYFMAMMSLNLAVINLLPFPALDGGRIIFLIIRKVTGKAITDRTEAAVHMIGMLLLLLLMLYVTWNDIAKFIIPIFK